MSFAKIMPQALSVNELRMLAGSCCRAAFLRGCCFSHIVLWRYICELTKHRRGLCVCFMMRLVASFGRLQDERQDGHHLFLISTAVFDLNDVVSLILIVLLVDLEAAI